MNISSGVKIIGNINRLVELNKASVKIEYITEAFNACVFPESKPATEENIQFLIDSIEHLGKKSLPKKTAKEIIKMSMVLRNTEEELKALKDKYEPS
jgi:hypothetical protein